MATVALVPKPHREEPELKEIGRRLAATRLALGYTQDELADEIGVSRSAYGNWEQGSRPPDYAAMRRLKKRFQVPLDWVYDGDPAQLPHHLAKTLVGGPNGNPTTTRRRAG
jgi:transcriptional regulator with XRE-family HTH domain